MKSVLFASLLIWIAGCGSNTSAPLAASDMGGVLSSITEGVVAAGTGLSSAATRALSRKGIRSDSLRGVDDVCDEHASVKSAVANSGDADYPALVHYCLIAKNSGSPDSVQGAYALLKNITCGLTAAGGITFDGTPRSVTLALTTACFTQSQIDEIGASIAVTVTGSTSPTFAPYFSHGVEIAVPAASMTFKFATKVTGTLVEFASAETGQGEGAFAGAFNSATGAVWYEARMDRFDATCRNRDCGWARHIRLYADTAGSGSAITLEGYSGLYTDMQKTGFSGRVFTAEGSATNGLYVREFSNSGGTRAQLADPSDSAWALVNGTGACLALGGSGTCQGNQGVNVKSAATNGYFFLIPTNSVYTASAAWVASYLGFQWITTYFVDTQS